MKIQITHFYTRENRGDAAILSVLITYLQKVWDNPDITISTMEDMQQHTEFQGIPITTSFISLVGLDRQGKLAKLKRMVYIVFIPILWSSIYRASRIELDFLLTKDLKTLLKNFSKAHIIIPVGGGYLRGSKSIADDVDYCMLLYPILIAKILGKQVILHSQSIGPFGTAFQKYATAIVLKKVDMIITREDISTNVLLKMGIDKHKITRSIDAGFLFTSKEKVNLKKYGVIASNREIIGITVARKFLKDPLLQDKYESEIATFVEYISIHRNISVIFIPQVTSSLFDDDDRDVARRIMDKITNKKNVWTIEDNLTHTEIKAIYTHLDYIIGTRFHSVIFSLTAYIPAIAIEYEHKTRGIMKDLQLLDWVIKIEDVTYDTLLEKFDALIKNKKEYNKVLHKNLPPYIEKAKEAIYIIKNMSDN